ncbi:glucose 1-dehydrogenase [Cytobacillus sp. Hz8]|uniref:glucose 1-dehydrogenase n=1 Tax=Cytobacillus sp. Hz8 TaxID=3347168 RepID=UPI0035E1A887
MKSNEQVAIITGAANGIGAEIARAFAKLGSKVILSDIDEAAAHKVLTEITENGGDAFFVKTDVRHEEDIINLMKITTDQYGKIDILINNAGKGMFKPFFELSIDEWEDTIHTNLRSVFLASKEAAKYIKDNPNGGSIVNIASTRAIMSEPNSEAYAATKGGIVALTHALAASLSPYHITVNAISPGWIETGDYSKLKQIDHEQHFSRRVGQPIDIAKACLYLTDPNNDFVTGINLVIDGGMTRKMIYEE